MKLPDWIFHYSTEGVESPPISIYTYCQFWHCICLPLSPVQLLLKISQTQHFIDQYNVKGGDKVIHVSWFSLFALTYKHNKELESNNEIKKFCSFKCHRKKCHWHFYVPQALLAHKISKHFFLNPLLKKLYLYIYCQTVILCNP